MVVLKALVIQRIIGTYSNNDISPIAWESEKHSKESSNGNITAVLGLNGII
ncbi:MAG: hypothetical protein WA941_06630 [Nitrososphaeraceae archaeon]